MCRQLLAQADSLLICFLTIACIRYLQSKIWQICQALSALLARYAQALRLESDPYDRCLAHREMSGLSGCLSSIFIESLTV